MYVTNKNLVLKLIDLAFSFKSYKRFTLLNAILIGITLSPFLFIAAYNALLYSLTHFIIQTLTAPSNYLKDRLDEFKAGQLPVTIVFFWTYPSKFFIDITITIALVFEAIYYFLFLVSIWVFSLGGVPFQPYFHQAETAQIDQFKVRETRLPRWVQWIITGTYAVIIFGPIVWNLLAATVNMSRFRSTVVQEINVVLEQEELSNGAVLGRTFIIESDGQYLSYTKIIVGEDEYYIFVDFFPIDNLIRSGLGSERDYERFVSNHENSTWFDGLRTRTIG